MLRGPDHVATRTTSLTALDHRPSAAIADGAPVDGSDRYDAGEGPGDKGLAGGVDVGEAEGRLARRDAIGAADLKHVGAGDPSEAVATVGGEHLRRVDRAGDDEEV